MKYTMKSYGISLLIAACFISATVALNIGIPEPVNDGQYKSFPCPNAADILPCVCSSDGGLVLNCDSVTSDQELSNVFQADFPVKDFYELEISGASGITKLGSNIDTLTFQRIEIYNSPVQIVAEHFLRANADTLDYLRLHTTDITEDSMSFYDIEQLPRLSYFSSYNDKVTFVPPLTSASLETLQLYSNSITSLDPGTFTGLTALKSLYLYYMNINELVPNTLVIPPSMTYLYISSTLLDTIHPGALVLQETSNLQTLTIRNNNNLKELLEGSIVIPPSLRTLYLYYNSIETIHPGAFEILTGTTLEPLTVKFDSNNIKTLDQNIFNDLFLRSTTVDFSDNPLACGCDMAWIIVNVSYKQKLSTDTTCADGTLVHDLDPYNFANYC